MKFNNIKEVRKWKFTDEALKCLSDTTTNIYEEDYYCFYEKCNIMLICLKENRRLLNIIWLEPYNDSAKEFYKKHKINK